MMRWYAAMNAFVHCDFRELRDLYDEFQKYNLLGQIKPSSPLYRYKELFLKMSTDESFERFYLMFLKAYCDKSREYTKEHRIDNLFDNPNPQKSCPLYGNDGQCKMLRSHCYDTPSNLCETIRRAYNLGFVDCHSIISKNKNEQEKNDHDID